MEGEKGVVRGVVYGVVRGWGLKILQQILIMQVSLDLGHLFNQNFYETYLLV